MRDVEEAVLFVGCSNRLLSEDFLRKLDDLDRRMMISDAISIDVRPCRPSCRLGEEVRFCTDPREAAVKNDELVCFEFK